MTQAAQVGEFTMRRAPEWNVYDCDTCKAEGTPHQVNKVPDGFTDRFSCWGSGVPRTAFQCSACGRKGRSMVSSDVVGGCW